MKKSTLTYLIALVCFANLNAQSSYFNVIESAKSKSQFKYSTIEAIYNIDNDNTVIVRHNDRNLFFDFFDNNGKMLDGKFLKLKKKELIIGKLFYNNQLKIFTVVSPSKTERTINCYVLDVNDKKIENIKLFSTIVEKKQSLISGQNKRQTNLSISPNEKFLVLATDNIRKHSNSYLIHVFNAKSLKLLYSKNYYTHYEKFFTHNSMMVDNQGNIYNLGKEYKKGRKEKKKGNANYSFILNKVSKDTVLTQQINLDEKEHIKALKIILKNDTMNLIGFYSGKNVNAIKGVTLIKVDINNLAIMDKENFDLPTKIYEDLYGEISEINKKELHRFYLDYFLEDNLGNIYLLAEEFYTTQSYTPNGMNGGYTTSTSHYDDILILKFNIKGKLEWGRSIFKRANEPNYNAFIMNEKLHVLLNSGKNLIKTEDGRVKVSKGWFESTSLYDFIFDKEGNMSHEKIQDNKGKTKYNPFYGSYKGGKFVIFNHSDNNHQLMILKTKN